MDVSIRQIRSFIAVARSGSFTQAAGLLHVSQPTLTVQIRRLEESLRVRLFDRNTRSVELTRIGRDLLPVFERTLQDLDAVILDLRDAAAETRGIVRLAALPSYAAGPLPDAVKIFRETRPGVSFVLRDAIASRVVALVRSEEVDLGLTGGEVVHPDLEILFSARDEMSVIHPQGHPIERAASVTAAVLAAYPLVLMHPDTSVRSVTDAAFAAVGLAPSPTAEATYMMTAVAMVRAGLGITILPSLTREVRAEPSLSTRPINDPNFARPIALIKRAGRTLPPVSEAFAKLLASCR